MDPIHRRSSSSSDRFLGPFTLSASATNTASAADELNEAELFWSTDVSESENQRPMPPPVEKNRLRPLDSGILVLLSETDRHEPLFRGKSLVSSSRMIPRPPSGPNSEYLAQSVPSRKFQQSAPMKVPIPMSKGVPRKKNFDDFEYLDDNDDDDQMLPPHEIVARGSSVSPKTTFSVLEGVGRTLKGRDLRQVRNAVLRRTGFLD